MLKIINCNLFRKKKIKFHSGLNVVIGDINASNSIGKSTLLMIVDFIFAGNTYIDHNKDVVKELGAHEFQFEFVFNEKSHYFLRTTDQSEVVKTCDKDYNVLSEVSLFNYSNFLKSQYSLANIDLSFREIVSLYSRIWGKPNQFVKKPLQGFDKEKDKDSVVKLLKLFKQYPLLKDLIEKIKKEQEDKSIFNKAVTNKLIPKVSKSDYSKNAIQLSQLESELDDIKNNILKYTINVDELTNKELLTLKGEKDNLLKVEFSIQNKKKRIESNLEEKSPIKSKNLRQLVTYFPNSNREKIETIEEFHSKLSKILRTEFQNELIHINEKLALVSSEISEIDSRIENLLSNSGNPIKIVNRIYDLTYETREVKSKNDAYAKKEMFNQNINAWNEELHEKAEIVTKEIELLINTSLLYLNKKVHDDSRTPPVFSLSKDKYAFSLVQNTGTGKAFINLILFDLSIYELTELPILIHDSFLFKNIETSTIENLIAIYYSFRKQTFIAIDEIGKYDSAAQKILTTQKCLELNNTDLLFTKDWRDKKID
jgi:hypothetical protein